MLAMLLLAAAYVGMPWYAASQVAATAHSEDMDRFRGYVDLPAVRTNLKRHLQQSLRGSMGEDMPRDLSDFLSAGANLFLGPLLEGLVTGESLAALLRGGDALWQFERELYPPQPGRELSPAGSDDKTDEDAGYLQLRRWGFTGINHIAADYGASDKTELRLILERQGLHWRVVELRFPEMEEKEQDRGENDENG